MGIGLFGMCENVTIENLIVEGSINAKTYNNVGGICGYANDNNVITNCINNATITGYMNVGGICGKPYDAADISKCINKGTINGYSNVGGICGYYVDGPFSQSIKNCWNTGKIDGTSGYVGGICGNFCGDSIEYCDNKATIKGQGYIGGICGSFRGNKMFACASIGNVIDRSTYFGNRTNCGLICGRFCGYHSEIIWCCAEPFGDTPLYSDYSLGTNIYDSVAFIQSGKLTLNIPQNLNEIKNYIDINVLDKLLSPSGIFINVDDYLYYPSFEYVGGFVDQGYASQLLNDFAALDTFCVLGAVVESGDKEKILSKVMEIYPIWIDIIHAIKNEEVYNYEFDNSKKLDLPLVEPITFNENIIADFTKLVRVDKTNDNEEILNCVLEIYPDIVDELEVIIEENNSELVRGSVLSNGSIGIICAIGGIAVGFLGACFIFVKRKKDEKEKIQY